MKRFCFDFYLKLCHYVTYIAKISFIDLITQPCMGFAIKMALRVSEGISNFPSRQVFLKRGVETPKNSVFGNF